MAASFDGRWPCDPILWFLRSAAPQRVPWLSDTYVSLAGRVVALRQVTCQSQVRAWALCAARIGLPNDSNRPVRGSEMLPDDANRPI